MSPVFEPLKLHSQADSSSNFIKANPKPKYILKLHSLMQLAISKSTASSICFGSTSPNSHMLILSSKFVIVSSVHLLRNSSISLTGIYLAFSTFSSKFVLSQNLATNLDDLYAEIAAAYEFALTFTPTCSLRFREFCPRLHSGPGISRCCCSVYAILEAHFQRPIL